MTQPGDVTVINTISIKNNGAAPIARTAEILGSAKNVADVAARDAIPSYLREEGMTAWVVATQQLFRLDGGITNGDWVLDPGGSSGAPTFQFTMGVGTAVRDFVSVSAADTVSPADASALASGRSIGVVTAINDPVPGQCQVQMTGVLGGFAGLTPGAAYVLQSTGTGGTAGAIIEETDTAGAGFPDQTPQSGEILQPLGIAKSATEFVVNPSSAIQQF